jgi:hypothetical protein
VLLGDAHDVRRVDRFVRRDQNEIFSLMLPGHHGHVVCAEHVVGDSLEAIPFHHGNVLVGGRMKYRVRPVGREHFAQQGHIQNVAHDRDIVQVGEDIAEFGAQLEQVIFRPLEQNQLARVHTGKLANQFGANGSACARHHHRLTRQFRGNVREIELYRAAVQQIFQAQFAHLIHRRCRLVDQVADGRKNFEFYPALANLVNDPGNLRTPSRRNGDEDALNSVPGNQFVQLIGVAQNLCPVDLHTFLARVVIHETDGVVIRIWILLEFAHDSASRHPRSDDQGIALRSVAAGTLGVSAHGKPGSAHHHNGQYQIDGNNRTRISGRP